MKRTGVLRMEQCDGTGVEIPSAVRVLEQVVTPVCRIM
jgi:hypothetical protein